MFCSTFYCLKLI